MQIFSLALFKKNSTLLSLRSRDPFFKVLSNVYYLINCRSRNEMSPWHKLLNCHLWVQGFHYVVDVLKVTHLCDFPITLLECLLIQNFPDDHFKKASNSQVPCLSPSVRVHHEHVLLAHQHLHRDSDLWNSFSSTTPPHWWAHLASVGSSSPENFYLKK